MAKPATEREARRDTQDAKSAKGAKAPAGPLADASAALARGDVRTARDALAQLPAGAPEDEQTRARELAGRLGLDRAALGAGLVVLVVIALAATFALFLRHG